MMYKTLKPIGRLKPASICFVFVLVIVAFFGLYYALSTHAARLYAFFSIVCIYLIAQYAIYALLRRKGSFSATLWSFTVALAMWGVFFIALFPPFCVPDEPYHYYAAYQLSDVLLFLGQGHDTTLPMRIEDIEFANGEAASIQLHAGSYAMIAKEIFDGSIQAEVIDYTTRSLPQSLASNPFQDRLAPAIGLTIGRLLGLNGLLTFYCGRLMSLALFVVLAHFAVKQLPIGRPVMMTICLLPMTLHLAGSFSYDSFTISMAFLLTAMILNIIIGGKKVTRKQIALVLVVAVLLAPCKVVYSFIVFLILFARPDQFETKKQCAIVKALVIGGAYLSLALYKAVDVVGMFESPKDSTDLDYRGEESGQFYNLSTIVQNLSSMPEIYARTLVTNFDHNARSLVGGSLGWFQGNIQATLYIIIALYIILLLSCIKSRNDSKELSTPMRVTSLSIACVSWLAVMTSMLVGWTFVNENVINGLQGRYLLPVLPLLLLAIRPKRMGCGYNLGFWCPFLLCATNSIYALYISASVLG